MRSQFSRSLSPLVFYIFSYFMACNIGGRYVGHVLFKFRATLGRLLVDISEKEPKKEVFLKIF